MTPGPLRDPFRPPSFSCVPLRAANYAAVLPCVLDAKIRHSGHVRRERRGGARRDSFLSTFAAETATRQTDHAHWHRVKGLARAVAHLFRVFDTRSSACVGGE